MQRHRVAMSRMASGQSIRARARCGGELIAHQRKHADVSAGIGPCRPADGRLVNPEHPLDEMGAAQFGHREPTTGFAHQVVLQRGKNRLQH